MPNITVSEYAKHRGVHERSVRRYLADRLIPEAAQIRKGRLLFIDQAKADKALGKSITTRKELLTGDASPPATGKVTPDHKALTTEKAGTAGLSFHDARTLSERYKAALRKIELDEKTGRLVEAEQVKIAAFNKSRAVRDSLLNIPDRVAPILAAETDELRVSEILNQELKAALEELAR